MTGRTLRTARWVVPIAAAVVVLAGCASSTTAASSASSSSSMSSSAVASSAAAPSSAPAADLNGKSFASTGVTGSHTLVPGSTVTLTFSDGGVSAKAGCNTLHGQVDVSGGVVKAGPMASTMMACSDDLMKQDAWLSAFLSSGPTWTLNGDTLILKSSTDQMTLVPSDPVAASSSSG